MSNKTIKEIKENLNDFDILITFDKKNQVLNFDKGYSVTREDQELIKLYLTTTFKWFLYEEIKEEQSFIEDLKKSSYNLDTMFFLLSKDLKKVLPKKNHKETVLMMDYRTLELKKDLIVYGCPTSRNFVFKHLFNERELDNRFENSFINIMKDRGFHKETMLFYIKE